jgi:serine/threonine-protein kinase
VQDLAPRSLESAAQEELWQRELAMIAPIRVHGVAAGFVGVGRKRSGVGYSIEELSFLTIIGAQLGAVLERTQGDSQLDRYHLERRIGTGGMAEVFLAWQVGPGGFERKVALKRPLPHVSEDPNAVASFLDEAKLAAHLVHPNIAQVYDVGESKGSYFIVMEYVDGPSLRQVLRDVGHKKQVIPIPLAAALAIGVLSALEHAHRVRDDKGRDLQLVHRDVSPRNILLNRSGLAKLVDFGIARAQFQLHVTRTGIVKGTLPYMSPEQANDHALDLRADLYSAGAVIYEMLTGEVAFPKGPIGKRPKPAYALVPDIPPTLDRVLRRATEPNPGARYSSAAEMAEAILESIRPAQPAPADELAAFLRRVCPQYMGEGPAPAVEVEPEPEGDRTIAEQTVEQRKKRD